MKKPAELNFLYPFLDEDGGDYNNSSFLINYELSKIDDKLQLKCIPSLNCSFINSKIECGEAMMIVHVEQRTYRKVFPLNGNIIEIPLSELSPNYNLEIVGMVIAKKDISFGYDPSMNEIYSYFDSDFECEKGGILGYSNFEEFELPTESRISSIFTISEFVDPADIAKGEPYRIDLDGQVINILVLPKIKEYFADLRERESGHNKLLNSVFVYPAIELAIMEMFKNYEAYEGYKWCIALANKLAGAKECAFDVLRAGKNGIDKDELIEYTNIVLEDLMLAAFVDAYGGED